jgi:serine/threonine protein kinase
VTACPSDPVASRSGRLIPLLPLVHKPFNVAQHAAGNGGGRRLLTFRTQCCLLRDFDGAQGVTSRTQFASLEKSHHFLSELEPIDMAEDRDSTFARDSQAEHIGRILDSLLRREAAGDSVGEEGLLAEHPEFADALRGDLSVLRQLEPAGDRIAALIKRGVLAPSSDQQFAAELGPYKIVGCLGEGGMGVVLKAYEPALDRTVALKILRPDLAGDAHARRRFEREARAAAALHHPNIVTIHAVGQENGVNSITMEYVNGPTLAQVVRSCQSALSDDPDGGMAARPSPLDSACVREIFRQLLCGLAAAHASGLVHRDIKPSNILLDGWGRGDVGTWESGARTESSHAGSCCNVRTFATPGVLTLKIADFGLARMRAAQSTITVDQPVLGTPQYMSPEQARGEEHIDHRTDLYSAGVVLYEMLTGRTPFRAETPTATIQRILNEEPEHPRKFSSKVDPVLASLALRLMAKRPEERLASAEAAFEVLRTGKPVLCRSRGRCLSRRALVGSGLLAATAIAAVVFAWLPPRSAWTELTVVRPDPECPTRVIGRCGFGGAPFEIHTFPPEVCPIVATRVQRGGSGDAIAVAGTAYPVAGHSLFAFNAHGEQLWSTNLAESAPSQWPDCASEMSWCCDLIVAANIDGAVGEEIIVVGRDINEYPCRISVVDARTGDVRDTFWHTGHIKELHVFADFLGPGRPAIVARGYNNKLRGFNSANVGESSQEDPPRTENSTVPIILVLDPRDMTGLGPPRTGRLPFSPARPAAYAFADIETRDMADADIGEILPGERVASDGNVERRLFLTVSCNTESTGTLVVDGNLNCIQVKVTKNSKGCMTEDLCNAIWRPIIQDYEYIHE